MIRFYGYKKCGTCRKAEQALRDLGKEYSYIDITTQPPDAEELSRVMSRSGEELKKFFNTSGQEYRAPGMKEKLSSLSEAETLKLLARNGRLLKRPIITDGTRATVGFQPDRFRQIWK